MNYIKNKTKFNKKNVKGITLISLIVTIIVLLILAGVSILMLTGDNGILNRVIEAKESSKEGEEDDLIKMSVLSALAGNSGTLKDATLREEFAMGLGSKDYTITGNETDGWTVTVDGAGNLYEWVLQANKYSNNTSGSCKGGYYLSSGSGTPVTSNYGGDQNSFDGWITFRVALYLN